jgi:hypothetical protein
VLAAGGASSPLSVAGALVTGGASSDTRRMGWSTVDPGVGPGQARRSWSRRGVLVVVVLVVAAAVVVTLLLGRDRVIGEEYHGAVPEATSPVGMIDTRPTVGWVDPGDRFFVMTYGSSTCPAAPTGIEQHGAAVEVEMRIQGGPACTADSGPSAYALDLPAPRDAAEPVAVLLRFEDGRTTHLRLGG